MPADLDLPRIALLPEVVRNQIAAGEVIERPASIVKELVENALDAGATHVRVDLEEGGAKLVRVTDDGAGMGERDLELAFLPHATSKLRDVHDLEHIASLGFRGEALASIGSVARARIFSRPRGRDVGWQVEDEGGRVSAVREAGGPFGTTVEVRDLFFNTPARRRFLKQTRTELARSVEWLERMALAHPGIGFTATHHTKRVFDVERELDLGGRIRRTFGAELADALVPVHAVDGSTVVSGFLAPPRFARRDATRQLWCLNGRLLRDKLLFACLREAYRGFLDGPLHPQAFLTLALDPSRVDVNVHPTKSEVRFRDGRRLFAFLQQVLAEVVRGTDLATPGSRLLGALERRGEWRPASPDRLGERSDRSAPLRRGSPGAAASGGDRRAQEPLVVREVPPRPSSAGPATPPITDLPLAEATAFAGDHTLDDLRDDFAGPYVVVDRTYIVRALADGFEIVDQHALHERLTFEGLKRDLAAGQLEVQRFLVPELVELDRAGVALASERAADLARIGIEVSEFGPTTLAVHGLPARLAHGRAQAVLEGALAALREGERALERSELLEDVLHRTACRSSVMAGDELDLAEIRALLERSAALTHDQTCPHGRPTRVRFTLADLERAFHRR